MRFSKETPYGFLKIAVFALCLTLLGAASSCSALLDDEETYESSTGESVTTTVSMTSEETDETLPGMSFDRISKAYIYNAWYDVEKDNPASYNTIDSGNAYALKCVFYFNEPVTGNFRAILKKDGQQAAVKRIRVDGKVIAECDFSAGLEGLSTFGKGTYNICLETDGKNIAASSDMRVE